MLGIDDSGFNRERKEIFTKIPIYGVIMKGTSHVEGVMQTEMELDSLKITDLLIQMISQSAHFPQIKVIFLSSITIGGFGLIDIHKMYEVLKIPITVVMRKKPDYERITSTIKKLFSDSDLRLSILQKAGILEKVIGYENVYFQTVGINLQEAQSYYKQSVAVGYVPEVLRIAHLIGASYYKFIILKNQ